MLFVIEFDARGIEVDTELPLPPLPLNDEVDEESPDD